MSAMDIILAFPAPLLALSIITFTDARDIPHLLAIGIVAIPAIARLVRGQHVELPREFVLASRTLGASHLRVIARADPAQRGAAGPVVRGHRRGGRHRVESGLAFLGFRSRCPRPRGAA
jgi:peptide/nickel transport system permease protein